MSTPNKAPQPKRLPKVLTARQKAFAREYLVDYNGARAAERAGYSKNGSKVIASRMLTQANVQAELAKRAKPITEKLELKASDVLERCTRIAFADVRGFVDDKGRLLKIHEVPDELEALIRSYKANDDGVVTEIQIEPRLAAVKLLMQNFGLLKEQLRLEISSELTLEETEIIDAFTDEELTEWKNANACIQRLLSPPSIDVMLLPASVT